MSGPKGTKKYNEEEEVVQEVDNTNVERNEPVKQTSPSATNPFYWNNFITDKNKNAIRVAETQQVNSVDAKPETTDALNTTETTPSIDEYQKLIGDIRTDRENAKKAKEAEETQRNESLRNMRGLRALANMINVAGVAHGGNNAEIKDGIDTARKDWEKKIADKQKEWEDYDKQLKALQLQNLKNLTDKEKADDAQKKAAEEKAKDRESSERIAQINANAKVESRKPLTYNQLKAISEGKAKIDENGNYVPLLGAGKSGWGLGNYGLNTTTDNTGSFFYKK